MHMLHCVWYLCKIEDIRYIVYSCNSKLKVNTMELSAITVPSNMVTLSLKVQKFNTQIIVLFLSIPSILTGKNIWKAKTQNNKS